MSRKFLITLFIFCFLICIYIILMLNYSAREFACYTYADIKTGANKNKFIPFPVPEYDSLHGAMLSVHQANLAYCRGVFLLVPDLLKKQKNNSNNFFDHDLVTINLAGQDLLVEIVNTPASITQGLSDRENIGNGNDNVDGMLFILPDKTVATFWMKDMKFDIDIVWISDNKIVDIDKNVPAPSSETELSDLPRYSPRESVNKVIELESNKADELNLRIGSELYIKSKF